jgi:hypothetical protein
MRTALVRVITQRVVAISYRRFGTTYRSHLQPMDMGPIGCPETSIRNSHYSLRNNPDERSSYLLRGGILKSRLHQQYSILIAFPRQRLLCERFSVLCLYAHCYPGPIYMCVFACVRAPSHARSDAHHSHCLQAD